MNNFDDIDEPVVISAIGRKRKPSKDNHSRETIKKMKHSGRGKMPAVICKHTKDSNFCNADTLTPGDIQRNFFYDDPTKIKQDQAMLQLITVKKVQRRRPKVDETGSRKNRNVTTQYYLLTEDHPRKIPVCKATFFSVLDVMTELQHPRVDMCGAAHINSGGRQHGSEAEERSTRPKLRRSRSMIIPPEFCAEIEAQKRKDSVWTSASEHTEAVS